VGIVVFISIEGCITTEGVKITVVVGDIEDERGNEVVKVVAIITVGIAVGSIDGGIEGSLVQTENKFSL